MNAAKQMPEAMRRVGKYEFDIVAADPAVEVDRDRVTRSDIVAAWLLDQWQRQQRRHLAERN